MEFVCENCLKLHNGKFASGRFCSKECSRGFSTKNKRIEINEKVSLKLQGRPTWTKGKVGTRKGKIGSRNGLELIEREFRKCKKCSNKFKVSINSRKNFCNRSCASSFYGKLRAKNGTHNGFPSRKNKAPSFPEKVFIEWFNQKNIKFIRDLKANRFFIDFAFPEKMIGLEIDGGQHEWEERKIKDKIKDEILKSEGWTIIRIKWIKLTDKSYPILVEQFLDFIKLIL